MPYWVTGWVEVVWDCSLEEETQLWEGVINLDRFNLYGDDIPDILFGLTKHPCNHPYFANRGVPKDCCKYVADEVKRNEEFIKQYGEGDIGHTHALWSEILPHLNEFKEAQDLLGWESVFGMVQELCKERKPYISKQFIPIKRIEPEWIRFVVWGNW